MTRINRAFTLIELLVVIAIIGILAAIVLASLNTAKTKSRDASVQADIDSLATQAAAYNADHASYGTASDCSTAVFSDPTIQSALGGIATLNGGSTASVCSAADTTYAVAVARPADTYYTPPTTYWCADSTGQKCGINDASSVSSSQTCGC